MKSKTPKLKPFKLLDFDDDILNKYKYISTMLIKEEANKENLYMIFSYKDAYCGLRTFYNSNTKKLEYFSRRFSKDTVKENRVHDGILCLGCNMILISFYNHHFNQCSCSNQSFVDGGQSKYSRVGGMKISKIQSVKVDLLNKKFKRMKVSY